MGQTAINHLPYPELTNAADVPADIRALAETIDPVLSSGPAVVTTLPTSPTDGQEVYYVADAALAVKWHLRYNLGSSSAYKWEYLGGPPRYAEVTANENITAIAFSALPTPGPVVVLPLAGDYIVELGFLFNNAAAAQGGLMSYDIGATAAVDTDAAQGFNSATAGINSSMSRRRRKNALPAVTLTAKYRSPSGGNVKIGDRWLSATPVRVG